MRDCDDRAMRWMGRHRRRHGFKGFRWAGERGHGGDFRWGRKLGSDDLQLLLLALLAEKPSHGYELIKLLEERSGGFYSPSPGMVYPALTYLDEIGYASVETEGAKKLYRLTDAGRAHLEQNRTAADGILNALGRVAERMGAVRRAFGGEGPADEDFDEESGARAPDELRRARRELKRALVDKRGRLTAEEAGRIADILRRATAEILGEK
jgi:DNA-binding PadR family transcriptional regulator